MDIVIFTAGLLIVATWTYCLFRFKSFHHGLLLSLGTTIFIVSLCLSYPFLELLGVVTEPGDYSRTRWYVALSAIAVVLKVIFIVFLIQSHLAFRRELRTLRNETLRRQEQMNASLRFIAQSYQSSITDAKSALNTRDSDR